MKMCLKLTYVKRNEQNPLNGVVPLQRSLLENLNEALLP